MKAFDSITHESIWDALKSCGIEHDYINFLNKLYRDQKATVLTESDMFEIKKGTKLGAPLSSLLFNTVLQKALEENIPRWQKNGGMGFCLSDNDHDCFTNMRFAADVLQFASSKRTAPKNGMRIQEKYRKSGTQNPSREDENSQQPKLWTSEKKLRSMTSKSKY